jgi:hypothetical protein
MATRSGKRGGEPPRGAQPRESLARFARRVEGQLRELRRKESLRAAARKRPE